MAEPEMAKVLWGQGQRQPHKYSSGVNIQKRFNAGMW